MVPSPPQHQHLLNLATRSTQSIEAKPHLTLPDSLLKLAQLHPHLTAIDWYDPEIETRLPRLQISFHQLIQHAHRLSQFILQHPHFSSPQPSHRSTKTVALYMHKNPIMPIAMLAVSMSGAAYLNLEPSQPLGRLKTLLHQTSPLLLLTYNLDPESDDPELKALVKASDQQQLEIINTADYFDDLLFPNQHGLSSKQILSNQTNLNSILTFRARPESTAYIICTSGTTGLPKTIPITHSNLSSFLQNYRHRFGRGQPGESRVLQFASSAFDVIVVSIWDTLMHGATVCMTTSDALRTDLVQAMLDLDCTAVDLTPSVASLLLDHELFTTTENLSVTETRQIWKAAGFRLRQLNTGSEAVPVSLKRAFLRRGVDICIDYGPSETTVGVVSSSIKADRVGVLEEALNDIGRPTGTNEIYLLDQNSELVPFGDVGEICIAGPQVSLGYLNPELNSGVFVQVETLSENLHMRNKVLKSIYRTGDLARYLPDGTEGYGSIQFLGRKDNQVKVSGVRIELGEVEYRLNQLCRPTGPLCIHRMRIVVDQGETEAGLTGFIEFTSVERSIQLRPSGYSSEFAGRDRIEMLVPHDPTWFQDLVSDITDALAKDLSSAMIPRSWMIVNRIPLQISGKTDRKVLKSLLRAQQISNPPPLTRADDRPMDEMEQVAGSAWATALRLPVGTRFKADDHFVKLGGDSIRLMKLVSQVRQRGFPVTSVQLVHALSFGTFVNELKQVKTADRARVRSASYQPYEIVGLKDRWHHYLAHQYRIPIECIEDVLPTSAAQDSILSCSIGTDLYYAQAVYEINKGFEAERVAKALIEMVKAHPMMRTRFFLPHACFSEGSTDERRWARSAMQFVLKPDCKDYVLQACEIVDVMTKEELDLSIASHLRVDREAHQGFGWGEGNVQMKIFRDLSTRSSLLVWSMHHAVSDGWTLDLLIDELATRCGVPSSTPLQPKPNYGEFVKFWRQGEPSKEALTFWDQYLTGIEPMCWPCPSESSTLDPLATFQTTRHVSKVWKGFGRMKRLASQYGLTPAVASRVATALALSNWLRESGGRAAADILMGVVRSGREVELGGGTVPEEILGCCVSVLPTRIRFETGKTLSEVMLSEMEADQRARTHQRITLSQLSLVGEDRLKVLFTYQSIHENSETLSKQTPIRRRPKQIRMPSNFVVSVEVTPLGIEGEYDVEVFYDEKAVNENLAHALLEHLQKALDQVTANDGTDYLVEVTEVLRPEIGPVTEKVTDESVDGGKRLKSLLRFAWGSVLGVDLETITPSSRFRAMGGDSIGMMRLVHHLRRLGFRKARCGVVPDLFSEQVRWMKRVEVENGDHRHHLA